MGPGCTFAISAKRWQHTISPHTSPIADLIPTHQKDRHPWFKSGKQRHQRCGLVSILGCVCCLLFALPGATIPVSAVVVTAHVGWAVVMVLLQVAEEGFVVLAAYVFVCEDGRGVRMEVGGCVG